MRGPVKVVDIELSNPITDLAGLDRYLTVQALVRLNGVPIGYTKAPLAAGRCDAATLAHLIVKNHSRMLVSELWRNALLAGPSKSGMQLKDLVSQVARRSLDEGSVSLDHSGPLPLVTVAVCSRDRTEELAQCLEAIERLDYPNLDLLIVDNAPANDATERMAKSMHPKFRYVREPRPGLDWARNRAIIEARGEIIAFTDDDVIVDQGWVSALAAVFTQNPDVMAVTGLVVPYELETDAQILFEMHGLGGFGRGFCRQWKRIVPGITLSWKDLGTWELGTGANMSFRRTVFNKVGAFDPALDVGTITNGGGDLEMFFRVLKEGHAFVYEPRAIVRHRHRREYARLRKQLSDFGSVSCYYVSGALAYRDQRLEFLRLAWHNFRYCLPNLWAALTNFSPFPAALVWAEFMGGLLGLTRYPRSRKIAAEVALRFGPQNEPFTLEPHKFGQPKYPGGTAVRIVELSHPIEPLNNVSDYSNVRVCVQRMGALLGYVDIVNTYQAVNRTRLVEALVDGLGSKLVNLGYALSESDRSPAAEPILLDWLMPAEPLRVPDLINEALGPGMPSDLGAVVFMCPRRIDSLAPMTQPVWKQPIS